MNFDLYIKIQIFFLNYKNSNLLYLKINIKLCFNNYIKYKPELIIYKIIFKCLYKNIRCNYYILQK